MSITTVPTNIGGVQIPFNQIAGPLASLFSTDGMQNFTYPLELGSDPSLCHAIQFSIFDRKTTLSLTENQKSFLQTGENFTEAAQDTINNFNVPTPKDFYTQAAGGEPKASISLYMPETLQINYNSNYSDISLTQTFGLGGVVANSISDNAKETGTRGLSDSVKNLVGYGASQVANAVGSKLGQFGFGTGNDLGAVLRQQGMGMTVNPQLQLLYQGIGLRDFNLEFLFTPRNSKEAENIKKIIETFTYYSSPGLMSGSESSQFLTPPELFNIKFAFTSGSGPTSQIADVFQSAFTNTGLGFLNTFNQTGTIKSGTSNSKLFTLQECVLKDVSVDYAPNGWAAYNDGYPVQTRLNLRFIETQIITKDTLKRPIGAGTPTEKVPMNKSFGDYPAGIQTGNPNTAIG